MTQAEDQSLGASRFVDVALPLPLRRTFTYRLPESFAGAVKRGARLLVPFGNKVLTAYAINVYATLPADAEIDDESLKPALELIDREPLITSEILKFAQWTSEYYAAPLGETLKAALPAGINQDIDYDLAITESGQSHLLTVHNFRPVKWQILQELSGSIFRPEREIGRQFGKAPAARAIRELVAGGLVSRMQRVKSIKVKPKLRKVVTLAAELPDATATVSQAAVLATLRTRGGETLFSELMRAAGVSASAINTLSRKKLVEIKVIEVRRDPLDGVALPPADTITLNSEQSAVLDEVERSIKSGPAYKTFLLHGVTGSGKTEIYIRAIRQALSVGRSALMLVPEIALTPVFSRRLRSIFASEVAILHSNLSPGERFDEWRRVYDGRARVAIGTRSAIFSPLKNLGVIIVDEEHDTSYRQQESPFYNARDAAVMRGRLNDAVVVLGSATPSLETYQNALDGKYRLLRLANRIENRPMPTAEIIDMREVFRKAGKDVIISPQLAEEIKSTAKRGEQSIILLNRRGFSSFVFCRSCGETLRCINCDISLTYHRSDGRLVCHYCSHAVRVPIECPFCASEFLYFVGEGTEQVEDFLKRAFPTLRVGRIDRDAMSKRGELARVLTAFDNGEIDLLVGTQMLAKGHDFHNVTLVGVISVDIGLGLPDFRSAERTFQLLTQVAGRAGRGVLPGRVLIQTYHPDHYALRYACRQDYEGFFREEVKFRSRTYYPPFVALALIAIRDKDLQSATRAAQVIRKSLDTANVEKHCRILGPAPASIARINNEFRMQLLIKSTSRAALRKCVDLALQAAETDGIDLRRISVEIDPINLL